MPTPFKDQIGEATATRIAGAIAAVEPAFDREAFVADAVAGLDALELKARIAHVAVALHRHVPGPFSRSADVLCAAATTAGLDGWTAWPLTAWVERSGLDDPNAALDALACLTRHASAEFAIRPFIERHPETTFARLDEWAGSDDLHLRRLVSEGTRPRLPWGRRLVALQRDPSPVLPLLDRLRDDPEEYVRRSVANHLNDIAKDHPALAVEIARRWRAEGGEHVESVVRHGMRTLVKAGDPAALALVGADPAVIVEASDLTVEEDAVPLGGSLRFAIALRNPADDPVNLVIDYAVHHRKANGALSPKVFKLATRTLAPGESLAVNRTHSFRPITTRRYYPGAHRIDVRVNGRVVGEADFRLDA